MKTLGSIELDTLLDRQGHGAAVALAYRLGVDQSVISKWRYGARKPGMQYRKAIRNATAGKVRPESWAIDIAEASE